MIRWIEILLDIVVPLIRSCHILFANSIFWCFLISSHLLKSFNDGVVIHTLGEHMNSEDSFSSLRWLWKSGEEVSYLLFNDRWIEDDICTLRSYIRFKEHWLFKPLFLWTSLLILRSFIIQESILCKELKHFWFDHPVRELVLIVDHIVNGIVRVRPWEHTHRSHHWICHALLAASLSYWHCHIGSIMDFCPFCGSHRIDDAENVLYIELSSNFPSVLEWCVNIDDLIEIHHVVNLRMLLSLFSLTRRIVWVQIIPVTNAVVAVSSSVVAHFVGFQTIAHSVTIVTFDRR